MSTIKPITILTQNLIPQDLSSFFAQGSDASVIFNFETAKTLDTLLLKTADIDTLTLEYKADENAAYQALPQLNCAGQKDIVFNFPSQIEAQIVKLSFHSSSGACCCSKIILAQTLLALDNVLSFISDDSYKRGGHHYMADGSLVAWTEFVKQTPSLRLENVTKTDKDYLLALLNEGTFFTYIFYGAYEAAPCGEFALSKPPVVNLDRKTMLYQIDLSLTER